MRDYDAEVAKAVDDGDIETLLAMAERPPCCCLGPNKGEPDCPCRMWDKAVRGRVLMDELGRGRIVRVAKDVQ
jgi:hypothetical protein